MEAEGKEKRIPGLKMVRWGKGKTLDKKRNTAGKGVFVKGGKKHLRVSSQSC